MRSACYIITDYFYELLKVVNFYKNSYFKQKPYLTWNNQIWKFPLAYFAAPYQWKIPQCKAKKFGGSVETSNLLNNRGISNSTNIFNHWTLDLHKILATCTCEKNFAEKKTTSCECRLSKGPIYIHVWWINQDPLTICPDKYENEEVSQENIEQINIKLTQSKYVSNLAKLRLF